MVHVFKDDFYCRIREYRRKPEKTPNAAGQISTSIASNIRLSAIREASGPIGCKNNPARLLQAATVKRSPQGQRTNVQMPRDYFFRFAFQSRKALERINASSIAAVMFGVVFKNATMSG